MATKTMGKTRPADNPWLTIVDPQTGWTYKVLQQHVSNPDQQYASVFADVHGWGHDMGDTYWADIEGIITQRDPAVLDTDLPAHLRARLGQRLSIIDEARARAVYEAA